MQQQSGKGSFAFSRPWPFVVGVGLFAGISLLALQVTTNVLVRTTRNRHRKFKKNSARRSIPSKRAQMQSRKRKSPSNRPISIRSTPCARRRKPCGRPSRTSRLIRSRKKLASPSKVATKSYQELLKKNRPNMQAFPIAPIDPEDLDKEIVRFNAEVQRMMDDMQPADANVSVPARSGPGDAVRRQSVWSPGRG